MPFICSLRLKSVILDWNRRSSSTGISGQHGPESSVIFSRNQRSSSTGIRTLPSERVIRSLNQIIEWRGKPSCIRCDNGPEYISHKLEKWATKNHITLIFIQPGKPTQNAYVERFNRTVRQEWLELNVFESIFHAQSLATEWMWSYNNERPNSAIGGVTPIMKLNSI